MNLFHKPGMFRSGSDAILFALMMVLFAVLIALPFTVKW
jgi:hypothetical protein